MQSHMPWPIDRSNHLPKLIRDLGENQSRILILLECIKLAQQLRDDNCTNIQEKFADVSSWDKLFALHSEMIFAGAFSQQGFKVNFIPDRSETWKRDKKGSEYHKSPDISIEKDGKKLFVEVTQLSDDEAMARISEKLNSILNNHSKVPLRVETHYSKSFCHPALNFEEREAKNQRIDDLVKEFRKAIYALDVSLLPQTLEILDCTFKFSKSFFQDGDRKPKGYHGSSIYPFIRIPQRELDDLVIQRLLAKAEKRSGWGKQHKKTPYLIALDARQKFLSSQEIASLLLGEKCLLEKPRDYFDPEIIAKAKSNGWKTFLEEFGYQSVPDFYISSPGIFMKYHDKLHNTTGVVIRFVESFQLIPNPFADPEINCPDLQDIIPWPLKLNY